MSPRSTKTTDRIPATGRRSERAPSIPPPALSTPSFPSTKLRLVSSGAVFVGSLALYLWTLAPTVTLVDSGELILAAKTFGIAHPPGFPLYVLLAHLAAMAPVASVAARVNLASALFAALSASAIMLVVAEPGLRAVRDAPPSTKRVLTKKGKAAEDLPAPLTVGGPVTSWPGIEYLPPLLAGLLLACSRTLWSYATIAEVYTLNTFLLLLVFFFMLRWRTAVVEARASLSTSSAAGGIGRRPSADAWVYAAAFVFGLALGVHHVTIGLMLPALAALVYSVEGLGFFKSKKLAYAALCAFAGLMIYAYLPIAASRSPLFNWGDPSTLQRTWWHITGRQYQVNLSFSPELLFDQAGQFFIYISRELGPWWLPLGLVLAALGFIEAYRADRGLFWFLFLAVAGDLAYALNYEIAEDKDAYYLPVFVVLVIWAGLGAQRSFGLIIEKRWKPSRVGMAALGITLLVPAVALATNLRFNNRRHYYIARDYVENILKPMAPGGMLLTRDWQVYSPWLYLRHVEGLRADVVAVDVSLLRRSWYYDYLEREYPELMLRTRGKVDDFLEDLRHWEREPQAFNRDLTLNRRINSRFFDMILGLVSAHLASAPVYVTSYDIATLPEGEDIELTNALKASYQLVPQGLVFQVVTDRDFHDPAEPELKTRGLADGTLEFEPDDVVKIKVWPVYLKMLINRGRYLAAYNHHQRAIRAFEQVLALDPDNALARELMAQSSRALKNAKPTP